MQTLTLLESLERKGERGMIEQIGQLVAAERERCASICDEGAAKNEGDAAAVLMTAADLIRNPVE